MDLEDLGQTCAGSLVVSLISVVLHEPWLVGSVGFLVEAAGNGSSLLLHRLACGCSPASSLWKARVFPDLQRGPWMRFPGSRVIDGIFWRECAGTVETLGQLLCLWHVLGSGERRPRACGEPRRVLAAAEVCWDSRRAGIERSHPEFCITPTGDFTASICALYGTDDLGIRTGLAALTICSWGRCQATLMNSNGCRSFLPVLSLSFSLDLRLGTALRTRPSLCTGMCTSVGVCAGLSKWIWGFSSQPWRREKAFQNWRIWAAAGLSSGSLTWSEF